MQSRQSGLGPRLSVEVATVEEVRILAICRASKHRPTLTFADHEPVGQPLFIKVAGRYRAPVHNGGVRFSVGKVMNQPNPACLHCGGCGTIWGGCHHCWETTPLWDRPGNTGKPWLTVGCEKSTGTQWVHTIGTTREDSLMEATQIPGITYQCMQVAEWLLQCPQKDAP